MSRLLIALIRAYQVVLAPHISGPCCRFSPSCSHYCIGALQRHGLWRGSLLGIRRVLKCHPFGPCGHDPVPPSPDASQRTS